MSVFPFGVEIVCNGARLDIIICIPTGQAEMSMEAATLPARYGEILFFHWQERYAFPDISTVLAEKASSR